MVWLNLFQYRSLQIPNSTLHFPMKRLIIQSCIPFLLLGLPLFLAYQNPELSQSANTTVQALLTILPLLPFAAFGTCIFMGFRYNNGGLIFSALLLTFTYFCFSPHSSTLANSSLAQGLTLLLPLNFILFSHQLKRRILTATGLLLAGILLFEMACIILIFGRPVYEDFTLWIKLESLLPQFTTALTRGTHVIQRSINTYQFQIPAVLYSFSGLYLLLRLSREFDPRLTGYLGVLAGLYINLFIGLHPHLLNLNFTMIGIILIITTIEASFSMAYYDELTGLPGRRSLNEAMSNLSGTYAIGMMDIDHFKKFNDTYGHKVGDDVLKMVAAKLEKTTGRARVFRYGGEEFTAVFPGKTAEEARPHLEKLREVIGKSLFQVRSKARKQSSKKQRGKAQQQSEKVSVTISIGVVGNSKQLNNPEKVIKEADKVLYKAKKAGRNCVVTG